MTAATGVPPEVATYLAAVRNELSDLPEAERDDLVSEVEASLVDAAEEGGALSARLGPPEAFAAELRSAAGLHEPASPARAGSRLWPLVARTRSRLTADPRLRGFRELLTELAPIWWVARAYVAVGLVALLTDASWTTAPPAVPRLGDSARVGAAVLVLAAIVSVALGLLGRRRRPLSRAAAVVNVALLVAALPVAERAADTSARNALVAVAYSPAPEQPGGLVYDGAPVANVYPFSRGGRLLHDVLLYDAAGRPLEIGGAEDPNRRYLERARGSRIFNSFPIRYYEPGTRRVARPDAAPRVRTPTIVTPPLRARRR